MSAHPLEQEGRGIGDGKDMDSPDSKTNSVMEMQVEKTHEIATLFVKEDDFLQSFEQFIGSLGLPASEEYQLKRQIRGTHRPTYNVISNSLSAWVSYKASEATFSALTRILHDLKMENARSIVERCSHNSPNRPIEHEHIGELSKSLCEDRAMDHNFIEFLEKLEMPNSRRFPIEKDFKVVHESGPFYNIVSKCLETWKSRNGKSATYAKLEAALKNNGINGCAEKLRKHCMPQSNQKGNVTAIRDMAAGRAIKDGTGSLLENENLGNVVRILIKDSHLIQQWVRFADGLGVRPYQLESLYRTGSIDSFALFMQLIQRWISMNQSTTIHDLCEILQDLGFQNAMDRLMQLPKQ